MTYHMGRGLDVIDSQGTSEQVTWVAGNILTAATGLGGEWLPTRMKKLDLVTH